MQEQKEHLKKPISVFCSYAHEDEELYKKLEVHLSFLQKREELISLYSHQHILAGEDKSKVTNEAMQQALLILLLISPDFIASDDCYSIEMRHALERHQAGAAQVIPILIRPTADWEKAPFAHLQYLPRTGVPITISPDQDSVFASIVEEIRVIVEAQLAKIAHEQEAFSANKEGRKQLLDLIYSIWITNVLNRTLHSTSPVPLDLEEKPQLVLNPLQEIIPDAFSFHPVSISSKDIMQFYDDANGALLLLGDSGVGKTTLLLEIAKNVLERANENERHPIPVVLSLSAWKNRPTFFEKVFSLQRLQGSSVAFKQWLLHSLQEKYQLSRHDAASMVEADQLLLLLDGLDEIQREDRHSCIQAINNYKQEHVTVSIVICSKYFSYVQQGEYLYLQKAFVLRPLTSQKIHDYLFQMGEAGQAVSDLLQKDPVLQELVTSPLMLTILLAVSREHVVLNLAEKASKEVKRKQIFETYTRCLFRQASIHNNTHYLK
jgi:eukaryotic-like serine/threonine-protein kinase